MKVKKRPIDVKRDPIPAIKLLSSDSESQIKNVKKICIYRKETNVKSLWKMDKKARVMVQNGAECGAV